MFSMKVQITRHIESKRKSITNERSSIQSQPTINKVEKHEWYSLEEKISPLESKYIHIVFFQTIIYQVKKQMNSHTSNDFLYSCT